MTSQAPRVLVVGAGPVGLLAATLLLKQGISVRVVDQAASPSSKLISKAVVVHSRVLELLEHFGLEEAFLSLGLAMTGSVMQDSNSHKEVAKFEFASLSTETRHPCPIALPQGDTEEIIFNVFTSLGGKVERQIRLKELTQSSESVTVQLEHLAASPNPTTETSSYEYVLGCDGAHSQARKQLALDFPGGRYSDLFMMADAYVDMPAIPPGQVDLAFRMNFGAKAIAILVPLPNKNPSITSNYYRVIIDTLQQEKEIDPNEPLLHGVNNSLQPPLDEFQKHVESAIPGAKVHNPGWITSFYASHRLVTSYGKDRVFLLGDAAHIHSPVGGQGMNTGLTDAIALTWKLGLVLHGAAPKSLLDSYTVERHFIGTQLINNTDAMTKMATLSSSILQTIRNGLISTLTNFEFIRSIMMLSLSQLNISYAASGSQIIQDGTRGLLGSHAYIQPGVRVPNPILSGETRLYSRLKAHPFATTVLFYSATTQLSAFDSAEAAAVLLRHRYGRFIRPVIVLSADWATSISQHNDRISANSSTPIEVWTEHLAIGAGFNIPPSAGQVVVVIRPDLHVGYTQNSFAVDPLLQYIKLVLN